MPEVALAAGSLGWPGSPVAIRLAGEDGWAIASCTDAASGGLAVAIAGVLVAGEARSSTSERASVFAGYCPRAVLVPEGGDLLELQVAAGILGQGVVVSGAHGVKKVSDAEPTVVGPGEHTASARRVFAELVLREISAAK